jgi:hypothetical protein
VEEFRTSRGAYLRGAIEEGFGPPKGYTEARRREAARREREARKARRSARQSAAKARGQTILAEGMELDKPD